MKKRVFIIHSWGGNPNEGWFPRLKRELEKKSFKVFVPEMPNTDEPKIEEWVSFLANLVGEPDEKTYFVGHSIGCQTIMRYLETLENKNIGGAVFAAGWFGLMEYAYTEEPQYEEESRKIAEPWVNTPIDLERVRKTADNFTAIFSDNDPYVDLSNADIFREKLGAEIIIEKGKGHLRGEDGVTELDSVLRSILSMENKTKK